MRTRKQPDVIYGEVAAGGSLLTWCTDPSVSVSALGAGQYLLSLPVGYRIVSVTAGATALNQVAAISDSNPLLILTYNAAGAAAVNIRARFVAVRA